MAMCVNEGGIVLWSHVVSRWKRARPRLTAKPFRLAPICVYSIGAPTWIRTRDKLLKRELLYQLSYGRVA